jgi:flagellar biogenesis protein FliO
MGLYLIVRVLAQGRLVTFARSRLITVVESTFLSQHTSVHVVKVGSRYYLVGGGSGHVALISELPSDDVAPYIDAQRQQFSQQAQRFGALWTTLRKKP